MHSSVPPARPLVFGHRGASIELPENTLEAFGLALDLGADVIETDVHLTADGHVVVHHDATGERMACTRRAVADCDLAEIGRWNVGFGFRDRGGRGLTDKSYRVPKLEEALEAFPSARFNVDIKAQGAAADVLEVVARCRAAERVLLTSFHASVTREVRARGYRGETGLARDEALVALSLPKWAPRAARPRGDRIQIPVSLGRVRLGRRAVVERLKRLGYEVDFWVVNDPAVAREVVDAGADGIMTDDPRTIVPAVRR